MLRVPRLLTELTRRLGEATPTTKVLLFPVGNVVICGAKKREDLKKTWKVIKDLFIAFKTDTPETFVKTKGGRKKPRVL